jgi:kinesin family protein C1
MVFEEVSEFVQSALDGYHVCLFSYGQTGSGKTHTMQGSGNGAMRGIIPRAVEQILSQASTMQSQRWTFTIKASFLEIYNEELRDLLVMVNTDGSTRPRDARTAPKLSIKRNAEGRSFVDGINMVDIDVACRANGMAQLEGVISAAARARSVATTKMNAQSSRSHSVFMLQLRGSNEESGTTVQGALNLCDLAGSERLDRSGAASDAQRLKETQAINKSLSCLGDVFTSLANGSKHVPFRNSKLTYLLQDCLSGDGKALMFVNLSPTLESSNESLCSLRFAQRVNQVELGKATKHVQYGGKGSSSNSRPGSR